MNSQKSDTSPSVPHKVARLVQERGWNQEDFARISQLNRQTVRHIVAGNGERRLRNATIGKCAKALGLTVSDLRELPLERLLPRVSGRFKREAHEHLRQLYDRATQPHVMAWLAQHPERARELSHDEMDEVLSVQGTGGPLNQLGAKHFIELIERKRRLRLMLEAVAGTEYLELLERILELLYDKVQPYQNRR
jgi:transcriptional regulator with XRE-family HTH domain